MTRRRWAALALAVLLWSLSLFITSFNVWRASNDTTVNYNMKHGCVWVEHFDKRLFHPTVVTADFVCPADA